MNDLVSIVIPTYNHANFLKIAINSILSQTYNNYEIIIVDNNSIDNTNDVVNGFKNNKIKLIQINNNGIISKSRNLGLNMAVGKWVVFLDADDLWYEDKLMISISEAIRDPKIDVISTNEYAFDTSSRKKIELRYGTYKENKYKELLLGGNFLSPSATLIKKNFLDINRISFSENAGYISAEDYDFWLNIAKAKANFSFLPSFAGEYTIHSDNTSKQIDKNIKSTLNVLCDHISKLNITDELRRDLKTKVRVIYCLQGFRRHLLNKDFTDAFIWIVESCKISTFNTILRLLSKTIKAVR